MTTSRNIAVLSVQRGDGFGAERVLIELLNAWDRNQNQKLTLLAPKQSLVFEEASLNEFNVVAWPSERDSFLDNLQAARQAASQIQGCCLVHAWSARGFESALQMGCRIGSACSGTLHDHPQAEFHGYVRRRLVKWVARRMQGVVCVSDAVRRACEHVGYGVGRLAIIRNGIQVYAPFDKPEHTGRVRFGFLGMYAPWKGFPLLAQVIPLLDNELIEWRLYGELHPSLAVILDTLRAQCVAPILYSGKKKPTEIFQEIDVLIHASTAFDPLPTVLIEAAAWGLPVLAAHVGGVAEIVLNGQTGLLFPAGSTKSFEAAVRQILAPELRRTMQVAARKRYEQAFRVDRMVRQYRNFWELLMPPTSLQKGGPTS